MAELMTGSRFTPWSRLTAFLVATLAGAGALRAKDAIDLATVLEAKGVIVGRLLGDLRGDGSGGGVDLCRSCALGAGECGSRMEGELADGDCRLDDGSFVEIWRLELLGTDEVRIQLRSEDFDPFFLLADRSCLVIDHNDDCVEGDLERSCLDLSLPPGEYFLVANSFDAGERGAYTLDVECGPAPRFVRGDANSDGTINITDGIALLTFLFVDSTRTLACRDAADADDNGSLQLTDAVVIFQWLFVDPGRPPRPPTPTRGNSYPAGDCAEDPTNTDGLDCGAEAPVCE